MGISTRVLEMDSITARGRPQNRFWLRAREREGEKERRRTEDAILAASTSTAS